MIIREIANWFNNVTQAVGLNTQNTANYGTYVNNDDIEFLDGFTGTPITTEHTNIVNTPADWVVEPMTWTIETPVVDQVVDTEAPVNTQNVDRDQLQEWIDTFTNNTGFNPNRVVMHPAVWERMQEFNEATRFWNVGTLHPLDPRISLPSHVAADGQSPVEDHHSPTYR